MQGRLKTSQGRLRAGELVGINFDPAVFTVTDADVQPGTLTGTWNIVSNINASTGQMDRCIDVTQRGGLDGSGVGIPPRLARARCATHQPSDLMAVGAEPAHQRRADQSARTRDQDVHARTLRSLRANCVLCRERAQIPSNPGHRLAQPREPRAGDDR